MTSAEIRQSFLDFFKSKGHTIVPSSSLMPDSPNLLFTNAGMNQFVPIFLGQRKPDVDKWAGAIGDRNTVATRAADTQKCIRAGGKHNDLEDVGLDTYHHTFFEMLGNWSFGDYFKKEAIDWAWELVVGVWKFPVNRIYATIYKPDLSKGDPSEVDQEAWDIWAEKFRAAGLDPKAHIVYGNKKDNFWMMGDTGPCGPCSEIHVDLTPNGDTKGALVNKGDARCIEIWNLVFIQFNANPDGTFSPLPAKHVDTGMGFERVTGIIQNTKNFTDFSKTISNYETDIFRPLFDKLEQLSGKKYKSTLPGEHTRPRVSQSAPPPIAREASGIAEAKFSRRNLPHFERPWAKYMVTFSTWERRELAPPERDITLKSILYAHEHRQYELYAACVMPDHVHLLFESQIKEQDKEGKPVFWSLSEILQGIKSTSAHNINKASKQKGFVWEKESMDRMIRGQSDMEEKFHYICRNPWDAGVVPMTENYPWLWTPSGSARAPRAAVGAPADSTNDEAASVFTPPSSDSGRPAPTARAQSATREGACAPQAETEQEKIDIAFRVIADHIRTLSFAIADGIQPGNNDRNYVLRRILRRAVRYGRTLGFHEPFFYKLVDVLTEKMGHVFPEIREKQKHVQDVIRIEEEAFNKTLDRGIELFEQQYDDYKKLSAVIELNKDIPTYSSTSIRTGKGKWISGIDSDGIVKATFAFELYDTYGFPLDLTELMARERGLTVDVEGFNKLMEEQRARARAAQKKEIISLSQIETTAPTKFVGYDKLQTSAKVLEVVGVKDKTAVVLDTSSLYAEMGGQVGDTGELEHGAQLWRIVNTQKTGNTWLHFIEGEHTRPRVSQSAPSPIASSRGEDLVGEAPTNTREGACAPQKIIALPIVGEAVTVAVDRPRRDSIQRHHTVTHLLHWALHEVASREASQKGSYVGPEKLTFDFSSAPLTPQQVRDVEKLVNEHIVENAGVSWTEVPYAEVKGRKDVMQFFGDKYGDVVRVVQIGGDAKALNGFSMELCGGTHTRATGEIGLFRIIGESAIAAGVRRIEAVAGLEAYRRANDELHLIKTLADKVNSPVHELDKKIEALLAHQKQLEKSLKQAIARNAAQTASWLLTRAQEVNGIPLIMQSFPDSDGDYLQAVVDALKGRFKGVVVLGGAVNGAVALVASVSSDFTAKVQAGKIIQTIALIVGGKGGGKPDNARGGGKDASKLDEALAKVRAILS